MELDEIVIDKDYGEESEEENEILPLKHLCAITIASNNFPAKKLEKLPKECKELVEFYHYRYQRLSVKNCKNIFKEAITKNDAKRIKECDEFILHCMQKIPITPRDLLNDAIKVEQLGQRIDRHSNDFKLKAKKLLPDDKELQDIYFNHHFKEITNAADNYVIERECCCIKSFCLGLCCCGTAIVSILSGLIIFYIEQHNQ